MCKCTKQTNKLTGRGEITSTLLCDSETIHTANLTQNCFLCAVVILFQFQHTVSRTADKQMKNKHGTRNFKYHINILETCPYFCDILVQSVLSSPATGPTWNAWWSWSTWTCWGKGWHVPLSTPVQMQLICGSFVCG